MATEIHKICDNFTTSELLTAARQLGINPCGDDKYDVAVSLWAREVSLDRIQQLIQTLTINMHAESAGGSPPSPGPYEDIIASYNFDSCRTTTEKPAPVVRPVGGLPSSFYEQLDELLMNMSGKPARNDNRKPYRRPLRKTGKRVGGYPTSFYDQLNQVMATISGGESSRPQQEHESCRSRPPAWVSGRAVGNLPAEFYNRLSQVLIGMPVVKNVMTEKMSQPPKRRTDRRVGNLPVAFYAQLNAVMMSNISNDAPVLVTAGELEVEEKRARTTPKPRSASLPSGFRAQLELLMTRGATPAPVTETEAPIQAPKSTIPIPPPRPAVNMPGTVRSVGKLDPSFYNHLSEVLKNISAGAVPLSLERDEFDGEWILV
ncbi:hypothetical protein HDU85_002333 [Gaertneriomyces sp. JEL0708]|nr:hypothetical protein HDU85_002333 [Gaertneriomyces sp. JEL0708]